MASATARRGTIRVAADPQNASADHQQVRSWIVELLNQGRGQGSSS
jgi:hypothetical protein